MKMDPWQDVANFLAVATPEEVRGLLRKIIKQLTPENFDGHFARRDDPSGDGDDLVAFELENLMNTQSIGFAIEIIPLLYPYLDKWSGKGLELTALDVGPRTGAGSNLIGKLFASHFSSLVLHVDTLDIDPTFIDYQTERWQNIRNAYEGDLFKCPSKSYDYVMCSHTIEHLRDPVPFCEDLVRVARDKVFIYCPFNELNPIPDHHTVSMEIIERLNAAEMKILPSWWSRKDGKIADCVFLVIDAQGAH